MSKRGKVHEVFLSHAAADKDIASFVTGAFEARGLSVFLAKNLPPTENVAKAIREALAECRAVVVLVTPLFLRSPYLAFTVGAGMAWRKAIYVLRHGVRARDVPSFLREFEIFPASKLGKVVGAILKISTPPLTEKERAVLAKAYLTLATPTDQLPRNPPVLCALTRVFNKQSKTQRSAEQLLQVMFRLRKQGKWPRLGSTKRRSS